MPSYAGFPFIGARSATPELPPLGTLKSNRSSKSPNSFSVISQPPPPPLTKRTPMSAPHDSVLPPWTFQPSRSLPLSSDVNPSGGLLASSARAPVRASDRTQAVTIRRFMRVPPGVGLGQGDYPTPRRGRQALA